MALSTPSLDELMERMTVVSIPLRTSFRGLQHREVALFDGPQGPGEWAAFTEYDDREAAWWLNAAVAQAYRDSASFVVSPIVLPVNAIIPAINSWKLEQFIAGLGDFASVKIKVAQSGQSLRNDLERVREVRRLLGDSIQIRLDANGAWNLDEARQSIELLSQFDIDYIEQPVATLGEMRTLKKIFGEHMRIAADETIRLGKEVSLLDRTLCDVGVIKPSTLGGIYRSTFLATELLARGIEVTVSSALETSVGLYGAVIVAQHVNCIDDAQRPHGLATGALLSGDVVARPIGSQDGFVHAFPPELEPEQVERFRASPGRLEWWRARLERTFSEYKLRFDS